MIGQALNHMQRLFILQHLDFHFKFILGIGPRRAGEGRNRGDHHAQQKGQNQEYGPHPDGQTPLIAPAFFIDHAFLPVLAFYLRRPLRPVSFHKTFFSITRKGRGWAFRAKGL